MTICLAFCLLIYNHRNTLKFMKGIFMALSYNLRVFRQPLQGKHVEVTEKLIEHRKLQGVQGKGIITQGYLNTGGVVSHILPFESLSELQTYLENSAKHRDNIMEINSLCSNFTNVISERVKNPSSGINIKEINYMIQFWFTAKFGKRADLVKTLVDSPEVTGAVNSLFGSFVSGDIVVTIGMKNLNELVGVEELAERNSNLIKSIEPLITDSKRHISRVIHD